MRGTRTLVEVQAAVVDAVQSALEPVVLAADAGEEVPVLVAQRHVEAVHAVVDAVRDELREHRRGDAVQRGVAEVVLPRAAERRVDDEFLGLGVVGGRRADGGDIRAVSRLGHRECAGISRLMMPGSHLSWCSFVPSCSTAEPKRPHWTPDLICRLGSAATSSFETGDVGAVVRLAAVLLGEGAVHAAVARRAGAAG